MSAAPNFARVLIDHREAQAEEADLAEISRVGSTRWREVRDEEQACNREDQRRADIFGSEE